MMDYNVPGGEQPIHAQILNTYTLPSPFDIARSKLTRVCVWCCFSEGKLNRGLSVIDSYMLLRKGTEVDDKDFYIACVLGWCIEWVLIHHLLLHLSICIETFSASIREVLVHSVCFHVQLQASALVLDDITDNTYTRRDNLCWYKLPTVGSSSSVETSIF
jgi:geranylgeranyl pyrophosphate synthase